jgi:hypothetical protein
MEAKLLVCLWLAACGGQVTTVGDAGSDAGTQACKTAADCPTTEQCGFAESAGCAATEGQCFPTGAVCNSFSPGCACSGQIINIACTGLPNGYSTAPLLHAGPCTKTIDGG